MTKREMNELFTKKRVKEAELVDQGYDEKAQELYE